MATKVYHDTWSGPVDAEKFTSNLPQQSAESDETIRLLLALLNDGYSVEFYRMPGSRLEFRAIGRRGFIDIRYERSEATSLHQAVAELAEAFGVEK